MCVCNCSVVSGWLHSSTLFLSLNSVCFLNISPPCSAYAESATHTHHTHTPHTRMHCIHQNQLSDKSRSYYPSLNIHYSAMGHNNVFRLSGEHGNHDEQAYIYPPVKITRHYLLDTICVETMTYQSPTTSSFNPYHCVSELS